MEHQTDGRSVMVIGIDFSDASRQATGVALNPARITRCPDLHLIHVIRPAALIGPNDWLGAMSQYEKTVDAARRELDAICASAIAEESLRAFTHVRTGEPYREIVQLASDMEADLVVIGTHSRGGVSRLLMGSVAERVQRYAPCPVLTVKPKTLPEASDIDPPCPECHAARVETSGACLWCDLHANMAHSFFPPSEPPPYAAWHEGEADHGRNGA